MNNKTETRLCPFRITVARAHERVADKKIFRELYKDSFGDCFGDAYMADHCKRLEKSEEL